jgi:hypothetical protein
VCITCTKDVKVSGGIIVRIPQLKTAKEWCRRYGIKVKDGIALLYKSIDSNYKSARGGDYTPKSTPVANDWDGGKKECGGGLHFSPVPSAALEFYNKPNNRFVACPVALKDMRHPKSTDQYPNKIKAKGCCGPVWECDIEGNPIK